MTENEALDMLKARLKCTELDDLACFEKGCDRKCEKCDLNYEQGNHGQRKEAMAVAIKALEEIQQYRTAGTVQRFQQLAEQFKPHVTDKTSCPERHCNKCDKYRKENEKYHAIGTVKECLEAMERQRSKKPVLCMNEVSGMFVDYADGHGEYKTQMNNWWRCPCCNKVIGQRVIAHGHIHDQRKKKFCENCGQVIDWSE